MPSVKAYQARKQEIAILKDALQETQNYCDYLLAERKRLTTRCFIFETYIRHAYWDDLENPVETPSTIPACLKPFDAIKFAGGPEPMAFPLKAED
jgi:hypothetical protein